MADLTTVMEFDMGFMDFFHCEHLNEDLPKGNLQNFPAF